jgi:hypothetical protein
MGILRVRLGKAPIHSLLGFLDRVDVLVRKRESLGHIAIAQSTANLEAKMELALGFLPMEPNL